MPDRNEAAVRVEGLTFSYGAGEVLPRRYWILVDLFETLGARLELAGMGDASSLRAVTVLWFLLSSFVSLVLVASGSAPGTYLGIFLALTVFQLGVVLVAEVAESLVNPVDGLVLAHQPVNGATWSGAKLHLVSRSDSALKRLAGSAFSAHPPRSMTLRLSTSLRCVPRRRLPSRCSVVVAPRLLTFPS